MQTSIEKDLFDAAKGDDVQHFNYVLQDVSSRKQLTTLEILERVMSPSGNSLLHVAAGSGSKEITALLCTQAPVLIQRGNFQGDTPLHFAARAGKLETTKALLHYSSMRSNTSTEEANHLVRIKNEMGNTALHDAVMKHYNDIVQCLVSADPGVSYYSNKAGKSPLYLVVEARDAGALALLSQAIHNKGDITTKAEGLNPVFRAIELQYMEILEKIAREMPELLQVKDDKIGNALHFASSTGYLVGVWFLLNHFGNEFAFEFNQEGHYPIHVACKKGYLSVVRLFIENWWDDASEYLTKKGQNILHVASVYGQMNIVRYVLKMPYLDSLIGGKDEDGNTALHLAAKFCNARIAFALVRDKRLDEMCVNNDSLTAFEVVKVLAEKMEEKYLETPEKAEEVEESPQRDYFKMMKTLSVLFFSVPMASKLNFFGAQHSKPIEREEMKNRINTLLVVAVLVAGVTFAGAIQYPDVENPEQNPFNVLKLKVYIYLDYFSFIASTIAAVLLTIAHLDDFKFALAIWMAFRYVGTSLGCMGLALVLAVDLAAEKHEVTGWIRVTLEIVVFLGYFLLLVQWFDPDRVFRLFLFASYYVMVWLGDILGKLIAPLEQMTGRPIRNPFEDQKM
ncbi:hypothetical protein Tsubulata_041537 [Turnera subulata]|uniref:PGG domain-containing protein n=1 Tax=Turnera subulata TaxID=218843 RepID=A0A9Q0J6P7_9ROSI|nr:hypothetical protein Tsubulata_041537 [Turnera subulata]